MPSTRVILKPTVAGDYNLGFAKVCTRAILRDQTPSPHYWSALFCQFRRWGAALSPKPRFKSSFSSLEGQVSIRPLPTGRRPQGLLSYPESLAWQGPGLSTIRLYRVRRSPIAPVYPLGLPKPVPARAEGQSFSFHGCGHELCGLQARTFHTKCR